MNCSKFCAELGFDETFAQSLSPYWTELSEKSSAELPHFMQEEFYTEYYMLCGRDDSEKVFPLMKKVSDIANSNPVCCRYASMIYYGLFIRAEILSEIQWMSPEKVFGDDAGIFHLMLALSALPLIRQKHIEYGLDESFMHGVARWIGSFVEIYSIAHNGKAGHPLSNLYWLRLSIDGSLFRIGRLEYLPRPWHKDLPHIYRNKITDEKIVLCRDKWAFDKNFLRVAIDDSNVFFTTRYVVENNHIIGTPVNSSGLPERKEVVLDAEQWELFVADGEECMSLHIPGGEKLTLEAVHDSLRKAIKFYKQLFNKEIKIFYCTSWLFNPVWQKELPDSAIAEWQRDSFLTPPAIADGVSGLFFVYGEPQCDPRTKEIKTSLHKAFCRIFDRNEKLRSGSMFIIAANEE